MDKRIKGRNSNLADSVYQWLCRYANPNANLCLDSRDIRNGDIFVACYGKKYNGSSFIRTACLYKGASAVLVETTDASVETYTDTIQEKFPILRVKNLSSILGYLANRWYDYPSLKLTVIAVTGTNGKTSCVQWIGKSLTDSGKPCGTIGTFGAFFPSGIRISLNKHNLTTPDVLSMHRIIASMHKKNVQYVAIEASSIGIEQGRLDGVDIKIACFTNLTHDHLDYHKTMFAYENSKFHLFFRPELEKVIINLDDPSGFRLLKNRLINRNRKIKVIPYSKCKRLSSRKKRGLFATNISLDENGQSFTLVNFHGKIQIFTVLMGLHNISNLLLVAGVLQELGISLNAIKNRLSSVKPVSGRLEFVEIGTTETINLRKRRFPLVVIDYAHTPDALKNVLKTLKIISNQRKGQLHCLFGAGGERDKKKRPMMGKIVSNLADSMFVTNDNPRSENPETIAREILSNVKVDVKIRIKFDRALAIMESIWESASNDVVLLAGRGNEIYQEIHGQKLFLEDKQWAKLALFLPMVSGISSDSRKICKGELFIALSGPRFDGHDFLKNAEASGACAAVVERFSKELVIPQFVLGNTRNALMKIASGWRQRFFLPIIAIAGSNGKTTTKEMISTICQNFYGKKNCLASVGNFNNEIGVSLSLLKLRRNHQIAIFELGMNHPSEISTLAEMVKPTISVITNAQREHLAHIKCARTSAIENGRVIDFLPKKGIAIYPGDDNYSNIWNLQCKSQKIKNLCFGFSNELDVYAKSVVIEPYKTQCKITAPTVFEKEFHLPLLGLHNLKNSLAAIAAGLAIGIEAIDSIKILSSFRGVPGRVEPKKLGIHHALLIDDTYNANPDSVLAAIDVLSAQPHPQILVLGDLAELGDSVFSLYKEIGSYALSSGIDTLVTLGKNSYVAALKFGKSSYVCFSNEQVMKVLKSIKASSFLIKGSRNMKMETIVHELLNEYQMNKSNNI